MNGLRELEVTVTNIHFSYFSNTSHQFISQNVITDCVVLSLTAVFCCIGSDECLSFHHLLTWARLPEIYSPKNIVSNHSVDNQTNFLQNTISVLLYCLPIFVFFCKNNNLCNLLFSDILLCKVCKVSVLGKEIVLTYVDYYFLCGRLW